MTKSLFLLLFLIAQSFKNVFSQVGVFRSDYKFLPATLNFYKVHTFRRTWTLAKRRCEMEGASLFYPENYEEAKIILEYFTTEQPTLDSMFIGVSEETSKRFNTIDGKPFVNLYNNLISKKNNECDSNDCLVMNKSGILSEDSCFKKYPFVCKKKNTLLTWNEECSTPDMDYKLDPGLDRCYKSHLNPLSWSDAFDACDAEQAYLAIVNSREEADYLINFTNYTMNNHATNSQLCGGVHLGFKFDSSSEDWKTTAGQTLKEAGYALWVKNQQDSGETNRCGSLLYTGELNGVGCNNQKCFFICEKEIYSPKGWDERQSLIKID